MHHLPKHVSATKRRNHPAGVVKLCACAIVALAAHTAVAESDSGGNPALDEAFGALAKLELGQNLGVFRPIEQAVAQSRADEMVRTDIEARLTAMLKSNATDLAKEYACRQLVTVGSDASIPVLAELLTSPRLSYMARYAMEGIDSPAAIESLREALGKTSGRQKVGVVISLGRLASLGKLADAEAVSAFSALLDEDDNELREAAVIALGRIGTIRAADALTKFAGEAPKALRDVVVDAELHAAKSLCRQGKYAAAVELCKSLESADSRRIRAAAFRGLISAKPSESLAMIIDGLGAEEPWKRAVAADCVLELDKPEEIQSVALAVSKLSTLGKIAAFVALKDRSHRAIREAALKCLGQENGEVRTTALAALIASATAEDVSALANLVSTSEDLRVRDAAFDTLRLMRAAGATQAMIAVMDEEQRLDPAIVRCALARRSTQFVPSFLKAAESSNEATRLEAFKSLEIMATAENAESLVGLLCKTLPGEEREVAGRAVWMSCQKILDPASRSAPLLAAFEKADAASQHAILPTLARMGGERALAAVHSAMQSTDKNVRDAGYRALANWPDAAVAGELLDIAKTSDVESYRVWSLRAYARVVSLPSERAAQETFEMLQGAMELATRSEDKVLIVSRLGSVRVPDALTLLLSYLDNAELKDAAVSAVFTVAKGLSQSHPDQASAALERVSSLAKDPAILQQIPKVLRGIEARKQRKKK